MHYSPAVFAGRFKAHPDSFCDRFESRLTDAGYLTLRDRPAIPNRVRNTTACPFCSRVEERSPKTTIEPCAMFSLRGLIKVYVELKINCDIDSWLHTAGNERRGLIRRGVKPILRTR
jgi:hypothetical protein